ncbi:MAG: gliding motility-associated C-terminal domain-containing protein, partial [Flavobacteriales bacterium]|nr:gliding motility-associated C-terminal domain-containing protein [Flavobacteriales bacterium]
MRAFLPYCSVIFGLLLATSLSATHNRAGEITYKHIEGFTYEVTIRTCTDISSPNNADRIFMPIDWGHVIGPGNNSNDSIERTEEIIVIPNSIKENYYVTTHTFPGPGQYRLYSEDPNRNAGVNNIPGSVDQIFSITTWLYIYADTALSSNNSVQLLTPPKEDGCVGRLWSHGVAAFDEDGDSLAFELIPCTGGNGQVVPGYAFPDDWPDPGSNGVMEFDQQFGIVTWDTPLLAGLYNIAIRITEYRFGFIVGSVVRDMQIEIGTCPNQPPINDEIPDVCVIANEDLVVQYTAQDPNGDPLELIMEGEPLELGANFTQLSSNPASATLQWTPGCEDVRLNPYLVYLRAEDQSETPALTDNDGFTITVIGPPVEGLQTDAEPGGTLLISWDPYVCADQVNEYKVYRRIGSNPFTPGDCETGLDPSEGYAFIGSSTDANATSYEDITVPFGSTICYRVVACFEDGSESVVSDEICDLIPIVIPVMTHVSVGVTDNTTGVDTIRWRPPVELDTNFFSGPYAYKVLRAEGQNGDFQEVFETPATAMLDIGEIEYIDQGLDTEGIQYSYQVILLVDGVEVNQSNEPSSVFLQLNPSDEQILLDWEEDVPWINNSYEIYRFDTGIGSFQLLGTTDQSSFLVTDLENNVEECFVIRAIGGYTNPDYAGPFYNWSQEVCATPFDNQPPCAPELSIDGTCEDGTYEVYWQLPDDECASDVAGFNVYYSPTLTDSLELLTTYSFISDTVLIDFEGDLYGCFAVSAFDSLSVRPDGSMANNESELSNKVCIESCPIYTLPNVISPNGDGSNDLFEPFSPTAYVDSVDFKIFNRWGNLIFETADPQINWQGDNKDSGERVSDGVYFYTITIFENSLLGLM